MSEKVVVSPHADLPYLINFDKAFRTGSFLNKLSTPKKSFSGITLPLIVLEHNFSIEALRQIVELQRLNEFSL